MRTAVYARFSTDRQREASIEDQMRMCDRAAAVSGLQIVQRFTDAGISGGTSARPGYQALLAAARLKTFQCILVEDVSRLWRSRAESGMRSAELEDIGVHLVTASGMDTRRDGYGLMFALQSAMAEHQRKEISYRTRRGMEGLALAGKSTGGRLYGYGSPAEAATVRRIFALAAQGARPAAIFQTLNREGVPGPRSPRWSLNAVKRILANPRYAGRVIWGATVSQGGARDSRLKRHIRRPEGALVVRDDESQRLVDPLIWATCNPGRTLVSCSSMGG